MERWTVKPNVNISMILRIEELEDELLGYKVSEQEKDKRIAELELSTKRIQREAIEAARDAFVEAVRAKETSSAYHFLSKYAEQLTKESE